MVFGEMNAGIFACAHTPVKIRTLLHNAHTRTATNVDDNAQGSHTFEEILQGWNDFLALCVQENWQLNATKTHVGYLSCVSSSVLKWILRAPTFRRNT
jgi:hypothetical protein